MSRWKWLLPWNGTLTWTVPPPLNTRTPLVRCVWQHWLPRLFLRLAQRRQARAGVPPERRATNYAVTIPRLIGRGCDILVAQDYIEPQHLKHEAGGHGEQVERMQDDDGEARGKASYTATYGWHFGLRRGSWALHMMELGAQLYATFSPHVWPRLWRGGVTW